MHVPVSIFHHFGEQFGGGRRFDQLAPVVIGRVPGAALGTLHADRAPRSPDTHARTHTFGEGREERLIPRCGRGLPEGAERQR